MKRICFRKPSTIIAICAAVVGLIILLVCLPCWAFWCLGALALIGGAAWVLFH